MNNRTSWLFNIKVGYNLIQLSQNISVTRGSMIVLQMLTGVVSIGESAFIDDNDYKLAGDPDNFNLEDIDGLEGTSKKYFQVVAIAVRNTYRSTSNILQPFNTTGVYNLTATIYNPENSQVYQQTNYKIEGF